LSECCDKGLACHVNLKTGFHIMPNTRSRKH